jgi:hypothetical protein
MKSELDPDIYIVMHSVLFLRPGVTRRINRLPLVEEHDPPITLVEVLATMVQDPHGTLAEVVATTG